MKKPIAQVAKEFVDGMKRSLGPGGKVTISSGGKTTVINADSKFTRDVEQALIPSAPDNNDGGFSDIERRVERSLGKALENQKIKSIAKRAGDILERGVPLTQELINKYDHELETINGKMFEGVVVNGKDFSFKISNKNYDAKK